jgi:hypothetical protein
MSNILVALGLYQSERWLSLACVSVFNEKDHPEESHFKCPPSLPWCWRLHRIHSGLSCSVGWGTDLSCCCESAMCLEETLAFSFLTCKIGKLESMVCNPFHLRAPRVPSLEGRQGSATHFLHPGPHVRAGDLSLQQLAFLWHQGPTPREPTSS